MIEQFIAGREMTVGILADQPLPILEIRPSNAFYDYNSKYIDDKTQFLFDTIDDQTLVSKIKTTAVNCYNLLNCRHFARVDFILSTDSVPYVTEANTIPGMTSHSLFPKAAAYAGMSISQLYIKIVQAALKENLNTVH